MNLQHQIDLLQISMNELKLEFNSNNTILNHLKDENKRLLGLINELQNKYHLHKLTSFSPQLPVQSSTSCSYSNFKVTKDETSHNANQCNKNNDILNINTNSYTHFINNDNFINTTNHILKNSSHKNLINNNNNFSNNYNNSNFINNSNNNNNFTSTDNHGTCSLDHNSKLLTHNRKLQSTITIHRSDNTPIERREIFIPDFMIIENEQNLKLIALSIPKTLIPSLNQSDIVGVRIARPKEYLESSQETVPKFTSFIITLVNIELTQLIIRAKKACNYFTTKDLNLSFLNSETACALPNRKIFINKVLSPLDQLRYIPIKVTAKSLGFKFVWHCAGRFLVRRTNGARAHIINSLSDLHIINNHYYGHLQQISSAPTASQEASQLN